VVLHSNKTKLAAKSRSLITAKQKNNLLGQAESFGNKISIMKQQQ
jgi:hypothetical protein